MDHRRTIFVSDFPVDGGWGDLSLTPVVLASAIHRTYNVRTAPSMVEFNETGQWAAVELVSHTDARKVGALSEQGIVPILHHRSRTMPPYSLSVSRFGPVVSAPASSTGREAPAPLPVSTVIEISNLPGIDDQYRSGLRLTETVIASMIHRTYNVRTHPRDVCFEASRTKCWIELGSLASAQKVLSWYSGGKTPILHQRDGVSFSTLAVAGSSTSFDHIKAWVFDQEQRVAEERQSEVRGSIILTGFPGENSDDWRFVSAAVIASILYRTFDVQTSAEGVEFSPDHLSCSVLLSEVDAKKVIRDFERGRKILLHHRDYHIQSLQLHASLEEDVDRFGCQAAEENASEFRIAPPPSIWEIDQQESLKYALHNSRQGFAEQSIESNTEEERTSMKRGDAIGAWDLAEGLSRIQLDYQR